MPARSWAYLARQMAPRSRLWMITAARFRAEASASAIFAASSAASFSSRSVSRRFHFRRSTHRRAAIWSLMTSSRSREYCPRASIPRTCACTSVAAFACARASAGRRSSPPRAPPPSSAAISFVHPPPRSHLELDAAAASCARTGAADCRTVRSAPFPD